MSYFFIISKIKKINFGLLKASLALEPQKLRRYSLTNDSSLIICPFLPLPYEPQTFQ